MITFARIQAVNKSLILISSLLVGAIGIAACATSRAGYETARYKVIRTEGAFELREYPELKIATTLRDADNARFMRLFRYIDGGNAAKEKIAMTTPVFMADGKMAFVLPEKHLATTPVPCRAAGVFPSIRAHMKQPEEFPQVRAPISSVI